MIDIHTHILPGIDDGSKNVEMSLEMLRMSGEQGVRLIAATPHFYAWENPPERFFRHRQKAWEQLQPHLTEDLPKIVLGAEVQYFEGITLAKQLDQFQIGGGSLLLVEMPFSQTWTGRMISDVIELNQRPGTQVLLAHIYRYMDYQKKETWRVLRENGILMQCNASFFLERKTKRKALKMLNKGMVDLLGSDCHNIEHRPPQCGAAATLIQDALGREPLERMEQLGQALLDGCTAP